MVFFEHMEYRFVRWAPHLAWTSRGQGIGFEGWGHTPWIWRPPYIHYKHGTLREMVFMGAFNKPRGRATRWGLLDRFIQSEEDLWADMDVLIERHRQYKNGPYRLPSLGPWRLPECFCRV